MKETKSDYLFADFPEVSAKQWKQQIQVDLKGADYNETLLWQSDEGINVKPFYHEEETPHTYSIPGQPTSWNIAQAIFIDDIEIAKKLTQEAVEKGADTVRILANDTFDVSTFFDGLPIDKTFFYFDLQFWNNDFFHSLISYLNKNNINYNLGLDPIGYLGKEGNWYNEVNNLEDLIDIVKLQPENTIRVDLRTYQNAGANMVQQLAYALSHANEYLHILNEKKQDLKKVKLSFHVAVGSNYFFEIAKFRALRLLYATLAKAYNAQEICHIIAMPTKRNKTLYDYNVNMLRTTTECMSAILGGADVIENLPYDAIFHKDNPFGSRIARNQLLILKEESFFDKVSNPSDGTYYIENLTEELANKALELFRSIEKGKGLIQQLHDGTIQRKISENATKEQELFDNGKLVLLGTNKHPNPNDRMKDDLELFPFVKKKMRKTLFPPIIEKRLAEEIEKNRLEEEKKQA